jgi:hypothetical protein
MALTLRLVKNDTLTFDELDGNFTFLSGSIVSVNEAKLNTNLNNVTAEAITASSQGVFNVGGVFNVDLGLSPIDTPTFAGVNVTGEISNPPISTSITNGQTVTITTINAASNEAAFYDYVIKTSDGNHKRAGGAIVTWKPSTSLVEFTDYSTVDIGNTSAIYIGATIASSTVSVRVTNNSGQTITVLSKIRLL